MSAALAERAAAVAAELERQDAGALRERLLAGHGLQPDELAGWSYGGTSLGLPGWIATP